MNHSCRQMSVLSVWQKKTHGIIESDHIVNESQLISCATGASQKCKCATSKRQINCVKSHCDWTTSTRYWISQRLHQLQLESHPQLTSSQQWQLLTSRQVHVCRCWSFKCDIIVDWIRLKDFLKSLIEALCACIRFQRWVWWRCSCTIEATSGVSEWSSSQWVWGHYAGNFLKIQR